MTNTCKYRRRGKVCRKKAVVTLLGYGVTMNSIVGTAVLRDMSIRNAFSYCEHCAKLIDNRCTSTMFVDENGGLVKV